MCIMTYLQLHTKFIFVQSQYAQKMFETIHRQFLAYLSDIRIESNSKKACTYSSYMVYGADIKIVWGR